MTQSANSRGTRCTRHKHSSSVRWSTEASPMPDDLCHAHDPRRSFSVNRKATPHYSWNSLLCVHATATITRESRFPCAKDEDALWRSYFIGQRYSWTHLKPNLKPIFSLRLTLHVFSCLLGALVAVSRVTAPYK